ncbi:UNVERIFIED_CONTAM: RNA polymerase RpoN-/SigL-like sigma 54 subunit [Acetivibrio alkalicellulosi]
MDFYFDLNLVQSQKIILTPQLRLALEILKMNVEELTEYIQNETETNPALDLSYDSPESQEHIFPMSIETRRYLEKNHEIFDFLNDTTVDKSTLNMSLKEHLLIQLHTLTLSPNDIEIGEFLIDNVDENGYLTISLFESVSFLNSPLKKVEKVLKLLQTFEPSGVCARDLKECLSIQVTQMDIKDEKVIDIINNDLDDLAQNKISAIAKKNRLTKDRVVEILNFIKSLEPKPGRAFCDYHQIKYIIPDVVVSRVHDDFEVYINDEAIPSINISGYYKNVLKEDKNNEEIDVEARKFIQSKIDKVNWLIRCIEQRRNTLLKISQCIVLKQKDFFRNGKKSLKPLTMKELAEEISVHESTVSRSVSGKYIQCNWGVFEMKYLFISKISGTVTTGEYIKTKVKEIINSEDKKVPLSDNDITKMLIRDGIQISRRTVSKYRIEMNIPSSAKRKNHSSKI